MENEISNYLTLNSKIKTSYTGSNCLNGSPSNITTLICLLCLLVMLVTLLLNLFDINSGCRLSNDDNWHPEKSSLTVAELPEEKT